MSDFSKSTVKELKAYCKKTGIKKYSKLRKKELIELIEKIEKEEVKVKEEVKEEVKVTLLIPPSTPIEMMTRYNLIMECKKLKIKGYSKMKKKEIVKIVKKIYNNSMQTHYKNENSLFFYPDIIGQIFSYIESNSVEDYRKKLIKDAPTQYKKANTVYNNCALMFFNQKKQYIRQNNYIDQQDLFNKLEMYSVLILTHTQLLKGKKNNIYLWLKTMKYNVTRNMTKQVLINHLNEAFKEL